MNIISKITHLMKYVTLCLYLIYKINKKQSRAYIILNI